VKFLLDTSAVLALMETRDRNHAAAKAFAKKSRTARFVVSDLVLSEIGTRLRARAGAEGAARCVLHLLHAETSDVVFADRDLIESAAAEMVRFADKELSLVDCLSFVLMDRLHLPAAFTFDRDFLDCGFRMVP